MTKHTITVEVTLTEGAAPVVENTLTNMSFSILRTITSGWGITGYEDGIPEGHGGYDGPFVTAAKATIKEQS